MNESGGQKRSFPRLRSPRGDYDDAAQVPVNPCDRAALTDQKPTSLDTARGLSASLRRRRCWRSPVSSGSMNCYTATSSRGTTRSVHLKRAQERSEPRSEKCDLHRAIAHIPRRDGSTRAAPACCRDDGIAILDALLRVAASRNASVEKPTRMSRLRAPVNIRRRDAARGHIRISCKRMLLVESVVSALGETDDILARSGVIRLLWTAPPSLDGNGRATRLYVACAMPRASTPAVWSVARGLARSESAYKTI